MAYEFLKEENFENCIYTIKRIGHSYFEVTDGPSIQKEMHSLCMHSGLLVSGKIAVNEGLFYSKNTVS
ncbi:hypothetical protein GC194_11070 [bacterium]|nr:hypothetical protein [bacterium]